MTKPLIEIVLTDDASGILVYWLVMILIGWLSGMLLYMVMP